MTTLIILSTVTTIGCGVLFYLYYNEKQQRLDAQAKTRAMSDYITSLSNTDTTNN